MNVLALDSVLKSKPKPVDIKRDGFGRILPNSVKLFFI